MLNRKAIAIICLVLFVGSVTGTYEEKVEDGVFKKKDWSGDWDGCTTATISCDADQYLVGEEKYGTTDEYSDYSCRPQWYYDFYGDNSCTTNGPGDDWLGVEKERSKSEATLGGSVSKTQCGANSGGGDEARAGVVALCYEESAFVQSICDYRGPVNECVSNSTHQISDQKYNISSIFESTNNAVFESLSGTGTLNLTNSTELSGFWRGSFLIEAKNPRITSGAKFRPENGVIRLGF